MKGIDISNYQSGLDFSKIDAEVCIIKATEGLSYTNPYLKQQYAKAKAKGMKVGYYHYLRANDAIQEAKHFLKAIDGLDNHCKLIIDAEHPTETVGISARTRAFADYLISQGKEVCIYTGLSFWNNEILPICKDIPLWVAKYGGSRPNVESIGWQYSGTGEVDLNIFDDGILLNKIQGVVNVATVGNKVDVSVLQIQKLCNKFEVTGKSGKTLTEDGIQGQNTMEATNRLKSILNNILK